MVDKSFMVDMNHGLMLNDLNDISGIISIYFNGIFTWHGFIINHCLLTIGYNVANVTLGYPNA